MPSLNACPSALVVDDNLDTAESFAYVLQAMGCKVSYVTDPTMAMGAARTINAEVVFLDIGMPTINGYELARAFRAEYGWDSLKMVAVTAYGADEDRLRSRQAGFDAHVVKPVSPDLIASMLHTLFPHLRPESP